MRRVITWLLLIAGFFVFASAGTFAGPAYVMIVGFVLIVRAIWNAITAPKSHAVRPVGQGSPRGGRNQAEPVRPSSPANGRNLLDGSPPGTQPKGKGSGGGPMLGT